MGAQRDRGTSRFSRRYFQRMLPATRLSSFLNIIEVLVLKNLSLCVYASFFLLFTLGFASISSAEDKDTISWYHPDFPPVYILEGPLAGTGVGDSILAYFVERMPGYHHETRVANFRRIITTIAAGEEACGITLLKNAERDKVVLFSDAFMISPLNEIITLKKNLSTFAPLMDAEGGVSLKSVMEKSELMLGYSNGRSYSRKIDQIIKSSENEKNSYAASSLDIFVSLMKMLERERIEYTIGYGYEAMYVARQLGFEADVVAIPLHEQNSYIPVYAGCPKTDWGQKVIAQINTIVKTARLDPQVYGVYKPWLDPGSWERYLKSVFQILGG